MAKVFYYIMWIFFIPFILLLNVIEGKAKYQVKEPDPLRDPKTEDQKKKTEENK
ncbi:hypothetical protein [uncultured Kiloniella sp.]|uniref:hypothetical protein n=1 Tax=uncultured Kiloniella sp. TaxID=1133091 RepID=UPI002613EFB3|nr:hypothetical protein [uncultured Kiloniella sp.]